MTDAGRGPDLIDARVRAEQVRVIYEQAPLASMISILVGVLLCVVLWHVTDRALLLAWLGTLAVLAVVRWTLVARFRRRPLDAPDMALWERRFLVSLALTGLAWGVGGWLIMPAASLVHQATVYFFLMGMAGGAVASYSAHATCTSLTIACVMLPATAWFVLQDSLVLRAMAAGGFVYIGAAYRATRNLDLFLRRSFQLAEELRLAHASAQHLALTDELTGMKNRRAFYEQGALAVEQARRYGRPLALMLLDIDRFKAINDSGGHAAGDAVIQRLGAVLKAAARATDTAGRLGGDEFGLLLPETVARDALVLAERVRTALAANTGAGDAVTCSIGIAEFDERCESFDALVRCADLAMYDAKDHGRDRVVASGQRAET